MVNKVQLVDVSFLPIRTLYYYSFLHYLQHTNFLGASFGEYAQKKLSVEAENLSNGFANSTCTSAVFVVFVFLSIIVVTVNFSTTLQGTGLDPRISKLTEAPGSSVACGGFTSNMKLY
jgi:hypothetical protein